MLLMLPLTQARAVMACAMLDTRIADLHPMAECCCPKQGARASQHEDDPADRCCKVVLEARAQDFALGASPSSLDKPAYTKQHDDPPSLPPVVTSPIPAIPFVPGMSCFTDEAPRSHQHLYLLTARLRL
jgi:hypothetical protein